MLKRMAFYFAVVLALGAGQVMAENDSSGMKQMETVSVERLQSMPVHEKGGMAGRVEEILMEPETGQVLFVLVSAGDYPADGGKMVVLPMDDLKVSERGMSLDYTGEKSMSDMQSYEGPKNAVLRGKMARSLYKGHDKLAKQMEMGRSAKAEHMKKNKDRYGGRTMSGELVLVPAARLLNRGVMNKDGKTVAEIESLHVDLDSGVVKIAEVEYGGLFEFGEDRRAVPYQSLVVDWDQKGVYTTMTEEELDSANKAGDLRDQDGGTYKAEHGSMVNDQYSYYDYTREH